MACLGIAESSLYLRSNSDSDLSMPSKALSGMRKRSLCWIASRHRPDVGHKNKLKREQ